MNIVKASHRIVRFTPDGLDAIDEAARTCYLSEPKDTPKLRTAYVGSIRNFELSFAEFVQEEFIKGLIRKGHTTPFEFMDIEMEFICDRGVTHEGVRHRIISPMQESTRYCNYSEDGKHNGITVIDPLFFDVDAEKQLVPDPSSGQQMLNKFDVWFMAMEYADWAYQTLLGMGASPQEARTVLPNSLKSKLKIKTNVREWRLIFGLRCSPAAHPQMREIMLPALQECYERWSILFEDIYNKHMPKS